MVKKFFNSIARLWFSSVTQSDKFSQSVQLTFKGKSEYQTFFGGLVSIIINILILSYAITMFVSIITKSDPKNSVNLSVSDLAQQDLTYYPYKDGFKFGVEISNKDSLSIELDEQLGNLQFIQFIYEYQDNQLQVFNQSLGVYEWTDDFPVDSSLKQPGQIYEHIYCPNSTNFTVQGKFGNKLFSFIGVYFGECLTNWKSSAEIDDYFTNMSITLLLIDSYVDFSDYDNTVKSFNYNDLYYRIDTNISKLTSIFIQRNTAKLQDSLLSSSQTNYNFWSIGEKIFESNTVDSDKKVYLGFELYLDSKSYNYKRKVTSILDFISSVGGLYEMVTLIFGLLVNFINQKLFTFDLIGSLYYTADSSNKKMTKVFAKWKTETQPTKVRKSFELPKIREEEKIPKLDKTDNTELSFSFHDNEEKPQIDHTSDAKSWKKYRVTYDHICASFSPWIWTKKWEKLNRK